MGAALKKLALMLVSDPKTAKKLGIAALSLVVAILMPVLLLFSVLGGLSGATPGQLGQISEGFLSKQTRVLQEVESRMCAAGFADRISEAKALCLYALTDKWSEPDFAARLTGCFRRDQTDAQLIAAVNAAFGVEIPADEFSAFMAMLRSVEIDVSGYVDAATKNNLDLVKWAISAERAGWGYVMGTFGNILTESGLNAKLEQYPSAITPYEDFIRENWLGRRTADCVGLIKGYCWFDPASGNIQYRSNGMPDMNESAMFQTATEKGTIDTIPEIPGLAVWMTGHIGIYIGGGEVIQAMGTEYGVVRTRLEDGSWTHWLKVPFITYLEEQPTEPTVPSTEPTVPPTQPTEPTEPVTEPTAPPDLPTAPKPTDPPPTEPPQPPLPTVPTVPVPVIPEPFPTIPRKPIGDGKFARYIHSSFCCGGSRTASRLDPQLSLQQQRKSVAVFFHPQSEKNGIIWDGEPLLWRLVTEGVHSRFCYF